MKISAVCQQNGLTDRTVRFYTEEGLLSPSYTKNYLGRKTFDFAEADVTMLKHIAVLRKYGFSIPEIREIMEDPAKSVEIIEALRQKKRATIQSEQELLDALLTLEPGKRYTVPELAEALNTLKLEKKEVPEEKKEHGLTAVCKALFWIMCASAICYLAFYTLTAFLEWPARYLYVKRQPGFNIWVRFVVGLYAIPLLGAGLMIILEGLKKRMNSTVRQVLIIVVFLCYAVFGNIGFAVSAVFVNFMGTGIYSETEDTANYLVLGSLEREKLGETLEQMFPNQIPEYALGQHGQPNPDTTRYYNFVDDSWDTCFEVYAQWKLTQSDLFHEKKRIREELGELITAEGQIGRWEYWSLKMDPMPWLHTPQNHIWESPRIVLFFAFDDETGRVRYIASYSDNSVSEPGFCSLDWE